MKVKEKITTVIISIIVVLTYLLVNKYTTIQTPLNKVYNVYLNGEIIGTIDNKESLLALIDEKQKDIKDRYNVNSVYPPNTLNIFDSYSYNTKIDSVLDVYQKIENSDDFTIFGYEVKITSNDDAKKTFTVNVLDKKVLYDALKTFVLAFVNEEDYNNYINGLQPEIDGLGLYYKEMGILEKITIREKYISTSSRIYENSDDLAQELLFGFNYKEKSYTIKNGDTIESISESNSLNPEEFLIANPKYSSKDSLLLVGDKVNITLINPEISFAYTVSEVKQVEYDYNKLVVRDSSKPSNYSEITTPGIKGISLITSHYNVVNGEQNGEEVIDRSETVREKIDQVTTKGKTTYSSITWMNYEDIGTGWLWPTDSPYTITSSFTWRWGKHHNGIDICTKTRRGSNIYAANDGVVVRVVNSCPNDGSYPNSCGNGYGNSVFIEHENNVYTVYAHLLKNVQVREGQQVTRGTLLGFMGNSGQSKGVHLHFGLSIGYPGRGTYQNPRDLFK